MTDKTFLWAWNEHRPQADPTMTPARAARLIRSWRSQQRAKVNGRPHFTVRLLRHLDGWREYKVEHRSGERASLWVRTAGA